MDFLLAGPQGIDDPPTRYYTKIGPLRSICLPEIRAVIPNSRKKWSTFRTPVTYRQGPIFPAFSQKNPGAGSKFSRVRPSEFY
jgi:hypothetical protein